VHAGSLTGVHESRAAETDAKESETKTKTERPTSGHRPLEPSKSRTLMLSLCRTQIKH